MYDALLALQALTTKTTAFQSTALNFKGGTPRRGLVARFKITNFSSVTPGQVLTPQVKASLDNTTFFVIAAANPVTCATGAGTAIRDITFEHNYPYYAANMAFSVETGSPTVSYMAEIGGVRPSQ